MNPFFNISAVCKLCLAALALTLSMNVNAGTLCVGTCPPDILPLGGGTIQNLTPPNFPSVSPGALLGVLQLTPTQSATGWQYAFSSSGTITSVMLPFFSDSLLSGISTPAGWTFSTGTTDTFGLGNGAGYMSWTYTGAGTPSVSPVLSFQSSFGPANATYRFFLTSGATVDIAGLVPLSPLARSSGLQPFNISPVPEPATWAMMFLGMAFLYLAKRRQELA